MTANTGMFTSDKDCWETPSWLYDKLNAEFHFTLDAAASPSNAKCGRYYTTEDDGLSHNWAGERVFCNPPYGRAIKDWVKKAYEERGSAAVIVLLIPSRTDTSYFHDFVLGKAEIRFLRGRIKFELGGEAFDTAPFPSMIAIYRGQQ